MPINFITGLPRHGKTLWTIVAVKERADREKRQVYTCNIPDVNIPGWLEIEHPDLWLTVPHGSIIIVDELQDFWQKAANGSTVPGPILELSKHGKRGIDFYFITQEPDLVHATPRSLCQHHYYVVRAFGSHNATVRKFERLQLHPDKVKKSGDMTPWRYPKEVFGVVDKKTGEVIVKPWYKSADVHNIKRAIPMKIKLIPVALLLVVLCLWGAYKFFMGTLDKAKNPGSVPGQVSGAQPGPSLQTAPKNAAPMTKVEYLSSFQPRVEGLAYTAPRYDDLTKPVDAPFPAACVTMGGRCQCYTQQGTKLPVPLDLCSQIIKNGFFKDWGQALQASGAAPAAPGAVPVQLASLAPSIPLALPVPSAAEQAGAPRTFNPKTGARPVVVQ